MRPTLSTVFFALALTCVATRVAAQPARDARAVITVVDMTGAILPNATVVVSPREPAGAAGTAATADAAGIAIVAGLKPGRYNVRAFARAKERDKRGTLFTDVIVPDMSRDTLTMSGLVLLVVLVLQVASLRAEVATARDEAAAAAAAAGPLQLDLDEIRTTLDAIADEFAALPRDGVVPTDSSALILERMTEIRDAVTELAGRVDDICRNAPIDLC